MKIELSRRVLEANDELARRNQAAFRDKGIFAVNLMSSPGAGKTSLLEKTAAALKGELKMAVIEGDLQTSLDAQRIAAQGVPAVQINTDGGCHLEAEAVWRAAQDLTLDGLDLLVIENVGNLVCPANFHLGEAAKVMILSTPEGADKPAKYPLMFRLCEVLVINKIDLLPHLPFSLPELRQAVARVNPELTVFELSALTGEGLLPWLDWLRAGAAWAKAGA